MGNYNSDQKNARFYGLKLSRNTDADLVDWLDSQESVQGYLKKLIRNDMNKGEKAMKTWYIVDDAIHAKGVIDEKNTRTTDKEKALEMALADWNKLTKSEQEARDDFYIAFTSADDDGLMDWNEITETVSLKV